MTTEFETSGNCATVGLDSPWTAQTNLRQIGSDPQVRYFDGLIYVVNRFLSDNIQVLDPARSFATIAEHSVGAGSNPQDIVVIDPGRAYVTRYESTWMYEFDPSTGMVLDSIDLSLFADADGLPEMSRIVRDGDMLFVQVQRIDRDNFWTPLVPGYLAVIDMTTNQVVDANPGTAGVQPIELAGRQSQRPDGPRRRRGIDLRLPPGEITG